MMHSTVLPMKRFPSLLPYIDSRNGIRIDFTFIPDSTDKKTTFPLGVPDLPTYTDPLAHLIQARLLTDAESEITQLFILLQRDQIKTEKGMPLPTDNPAITRHWQQAFREYNKNRSFEDCLFKLGAQLTDDGNLIPFQPLFYCSFRNHFFNPPCPLCGGLLDLCRDDDLLAAAHLPAYSNSLRRYLFCPTCYELAGETDFFASLTTSADKHHAKSVTELISEFNKLAISTSQTHQFPCRNCPDADICLAPGGQLPDRILPVAVYPFHMLIFKADSVNPESLSILKASKGHLNYPQTKEELPEKTEKQSESVVPGPSIRMILERLIVKWQNAAENEKHAFLTDSTDQAIRPSDSPPNSPVQPLPIVAENPDLKKTVIVSNNRNISAIENNTPSPINTDIPETVIIGARPPATGTAGAPLDSAQMNSQPPPISIPDATSSQPTAILPETMLIRPSAPGIPPSANQKTPTEVPNGDPGQPILKDGRPAICSNSHPSHPPVPTGPPFLNTGRSRNSSGPGCDFQKTFILGSIENAPKGDGEKTFTSPTHHGNSCPPQPPGSDDILAETIVVSTHPESKNGE